MGIWNGPVTRLKNVYSGDDKIASKSKVYQWIRAGKLEVVYVDGMPFAKTNSLRKLLKVEEAA